jgi:hypothetical protein
LLLLRKMYIFRVVQKRDICRVLTNELHYYFNATLIHLVYDELRTEIPRHHWLVNYPGAHYLDE